MYYFGIDRHSDNGTSMRMKKPTRGEKIQFIYTDSQHQNPLILRAISITAGFFSGFYYLFINASAPAGNIGSIV